VIPDFVRIAKFPAAPRSTGPGPSAAVTVKVAEPDLPPELAVIFAVPVEWPVATPGDTTVATAMVPDFHITLLLMSALVPLEKVPVATKRWVRPICTVASAGATLIDCNVVAAPTVRVAEPDLPPEVAVIVALPAEWPVATPGDTTVAIAVVAERHLTLLLMSARLPSEKVPVATKRCVRPICTVAAAGVTAIDVNVAAVTVKVAEPALAPEVAVIVAVPADTPVATPDDATVATTSVPELHVTALLMSKVVPSEKVPVATTGCGRPIGTVSAAGATAIDTNVSGFTVKVREAAMPPKLAVMTDGPAATPVASPDVLLIVATLVVPEVQLEDAVTSLDDPSANVAVATNCWGALAGIEVVAGVTSRETRAGEPTVGLPKTP